NKYYLLHMLSLLLNSSIAVAMEQKITTSVSWQSSTNGHITFYYTLAYTDSIYNLKTQLISRLQKLNPNSRILHHHNLELELMLRNSTMQVADRNSIGSLFSFYEHKKYKLTIINNKRKAIDPIDDPSLEVDNVLEQAKKKRKR